MTGVFLVALLFVILFSVLLQLVVKCPYVVAAIIGVISLIVYAVFSTTLGTIFIAWIVIYTLVSLITAFLTCRFFKHRDNF